MPIKIPNQLPARTVLDGENIFVMTETRAVTQDIRPLKMIILNLMPTKIVTETQLLRQLSNTPLQIEIDFLDVASHVSKNTDRSHLETFYCTLDEVSSKKYDGMIITGAPVGDLPFEEVDYWDELTQILKWSCTNVHSTLHICWGALAGLYYHYSIPKEEIPGGKISGVYKHTLIKPNSPWFRGFDSEFCIPHSRYFRASEKALVESPKLEILARSEDAGVFAVKSTDNRHFFITGHPEYDTDTLKIEYERDLEKGIDPAIPENYFPDNNPAKEPVAHWKAHSQLLYSNWLNYYVYQTTPYDLYQVEDYSI
ncbi:MAG: homoserine O-succinyltransferase [Oscillospiraceae bacterium]|nr:homoserine O-succinyltransferase [Oscillospiraceae bacterium]